MSKVLVVDDEAIIAIHLDERLQCMGYDVMGTASNGREAIEMARSGHPDVILMDIVMPGKTDGIQASEIIKNELGIPIIFLTAYASKDLVDKAKHTDPFGYIVKPFQENQIAAAIELALHKKEIEVKLLASKEALQQKHDFAKALVVKLRQSLVDIETLEGPINICMTCKKIRDANGKWHQMESYITAHSKATFSHGYCPECGEEWLNLCREIGRGPKD